MRRLSASFSTDRRSPTLYGLIQGLNVNEYLIYQFLHWGVAGEGHTESNEVLVYSV